MYVKFVNFVWMLIRLLNRLRWHLDVKYVHLLWMLNLFICYDLNADLTVKQVQLTSGCEVCSFVMVAVYVHLLWIGCWHDCEIGLLTSGYEVCSLVMDGKFVHIFLIGCWHVCEIGLAVIWMWSIFICYGWYICSFIMDWMLTTVK